MLCMLVKKVLQRVCSACCGSWFMISDRGWQFSWNLTLYSIHNVLAQNKKKRSNQGSLNRYRDRYWSTNSRNRTSTVPDLSEIEKKLFPPSSQARTTGPDWTSPNRTESERTIPNRPILIQFKTFLMIQNLGLFSSIELYRFLPV